MHAIALVHCTKRPWLGQTSGQTPETSVPHRSPAYQVGPSQVLYTASQCLQSGLSEQVGRSLGLRPALLRMLANCSSVERIR